MPTFIVSSLTDETKGDLELGCHGHQTPALWAYGNDAKLREKALGYFTDRNGVQWLGQLMKARKVGAPRYLMLIRKDGDHLCCQLDWGGALAFAIANKLVKPTHWVRGIWLGVEPFKNSATVYVDKLTAPQ